MSVRSPLRDRDFALLWSGGLIGDLGDWMLLASLPVYVYTQTGSATATSTVFLAELLPALLVAPFAGVLVDRWDRRRLLVRLGLLQALLLLPLLAAGGADRLWIVYAVAAAQSCLAGLGTPAKAALIPMLVGRDRIAAANSLNAVGDNLARLVGAPLGGLAIQLLGLPGVVTVDAVTFVLAAALTAGIRGRARPERPPVARPGMLGAWLDGLRVVRRNRPLPAALAIGALGQLAQGIFMVLFVVFVLDHLHGNGTDVGLLRGVQAIGGVLGGLVLGVLGGRMRPHVLVGSGLIAFGLISLTTWTAPTVSTAIGLYAGLFVAAGVPGVAASAGLLTITQTHAPPTHIGRVLAGGNASAGIAQAVGVLTAGALADRYGTLVLLDAQAGLYLLTGLLALITLRPRNPSVPCPAHSTRRRDRGAQHGQPSDPRSPLEHRDLDVLGRGRSGFDTSTPVAGSLRPPRAPDATGPDDDDGSTGK